MPSSAERTDWAYVIARLSSAGIDPARLTPQGASALLAALEKIDNERRAAAMIDMRNAFSGADLTSIIRKLID